MGDQIRNLGQTVRWPEALLIRAGAVAVFCLCAAGAHAETYRSPLAVAVAPDGKTLYVSDKTAGCVAVLDAATGKKVRDVAVAGEPNGLSVSADGKTLYVALRKAGTVAVIDTARGTLTRQIPVGPWPVAVAVDEQRQRLVTCNRGDHTVSIVDTAGGEVLARIPVARDPFAVAITPDGSRIVVTNYMPLGKGTDRTLAAEVSLLDAAAMREVARVKLPTGSTMVSGACISPDGRWAYVVHSVCRFDLPITKLERGWVHTYAVSIIDLAAGSRVATLLLDELNRGAADPWAVVVSADGFHETLWISHSGTHQVSIVDVGRIHELLAGNLPAELARLKDGARENVWVRIKNDKRAVDELTGDLTALHIAGAIRRVKSGGIGPRGMALSPDGQRLYVANYFSGTVGVLGTAKGELQSTVALGRQPKPDAVRRGEIYFHDATRCFQHWHSCATCHLDDGRIDGLPWDFLRDGIANGKDVASLIHLRHTAPHSRRGLRADPRECMQTGVFGSHQVVPERCDVDDLLAYVFSLAPEPNPNLPQLAEAAARGKVLFEGKAQCARCHPGPYFTDRKSHDVGLRTSGDPDGRYDTPTLVEAYRTAPYYHDGRALSIKEALTEHDPENQHGNLKDLTPKEIDDLVAYVLSL